MTYNTAVETEYTKCQRAYGLKVGDRVRVMSKAEDFQQGWAVGWVRAMDGAVGKIGIIIGEHSDAGYKLQFYNEHGSIIRRISNWNFPYFVLEKIK